MAKDNQINVRVNDRTNEAIESFAEDKDYTKTEAVRRMVEGRLAGEGYLEGVAVSDGGIMIEDRLDEIKQQQTQKLDEIEATLEDEPSKLEKWVYGMWTWSAGLTLAGAIAYVVSGPLGIGSINPDMAFWFTGFSALFVLLFYVIQETIR